MNQGSAGTNDSLTTTVVTAPNVTEANESFSVTVRVENLGNARATRDVQNLGR